MKIKVDETNKAIIATGFYNEKRIKAVCVCHEGDTFDLDFGTRLVKEKFRLKKMQQKMKLYQQISKYLNKISIKYAEDATMIDVKIAGKEQEIKTILSEKY